MIDTIVVKSSLRFSNNSTKDEYLPCAHLLCMAVVHLCIIMGS